MSWIVTVEVVAEEQADSVIEVLREAEEEVEIDFGFNTSKHDVSPEPGITVQDYFELKLAEYEKMVADYSIGGGEEMPVESVCGNDCKIVIDTCAEFCRHIKLASGGKNTHSEAAIEACWEVCEIYING